MIQITTQNQLHIHIEPIDFRKGIDGLVGLCRSLIALDPYSGTIFAFRNKSGISIKLLSYDGTGFWLMQKRFSSGKLRQWPRSANDKICAIDLMVLLHQGQAVKLASAWRALPSSNNASSK